MEGLIDGHSALRTQTRSKRLWESNTSRNETKGLDPLTENAGICGEDAASAEAGRAGLRSRQRWHSSVSARSTQGRPSGNLRPGPGGRETGPPGGEAAVPPM